ncbi:phage tail tape measure protein [Gardnerella greenwoodii]|uniref:phage tail tape measure protein n=1 Tax=Gardnerella greenwoodii TaxID=2914925 RepID=UPI0039F112EF
MAQNENITIRMTADIADYSAKLQTAAHLTGKFDSFVKSAGTAGEKTGRIMRALAVGAGAVAIAIGVDATRRFSEFDQAMAAVRANVTENVGELKKLETAALNAGRSGMFSATKAANAINELGKAGVSVKDIIGGGLKGALDLAAAGEMNAADAAELTASALNQFGLAGSKASHVADLLAAGANMAQGGVQDMGEALKNVGVNAHILGMSVEETVGALTLFASKGLVGSDAGTKFNAMLQNLVAPSIRAQGTIKKLGLEVYDSQGRFVGLANIAQQLHDKLGHLTQAQRNAALGRIFSNAALTTANTLYEQGAKGVEKYTKMINQQGFASKVANTQMDNLKGQLTRLGNAWDAMLIKIGSGGKGIISGMIVAVTGLVNAFAALPSGVQQAVVVITALVGAGAGLYDMYQKSARYGGVVAKSFDFIGSKASKLFALFRGTKLGAGLESAFKSLSSTVTSTFSNIGYKIAGASSGLSVFKAGILGLTAVTTGVLVGALAAVAIGFIAWQAKAEAAKKQTDALKDTVRNSGDVYHKLADELRNSNDGVSWFTKGTLSFTDALKNCGVSMDTFISAVKGSKTAVASLNKALTKTWKSADPSLSGVTVKNSVNTLKEAFNQAKKSIKDANAALKEEQAQRKANAITASQHADALMKGAEAAAKNSGEVLKVAKVEDILIAKFGASKNAISAQAEAINNNVEAMQKYYGFAMDADQALTNLDKTIRESSKSVAEAGRHWMDNTDAADKNMSALAGLAKQTFETAEAMAKNGESVEHITKAFDKGSAAFVDLAQKTGMSKDKAIALAKAWGISHDALMKLIGAVKQSNVEAKVTAKDNFSEVFKKQNLSVKSLKGGKFEITGNNKKALDAIAKVSKAKLDPKKLTLTLDKKQLQAALDAVKKMKPVEVKAKVKADTKQAKKAIADVGKAKVPDKTVKLKGDKRNLDSTMSKAKAAKVPDKTVKLKGDKRNLDSTMSKAKAAKVPDKTVKLKGNKTDFQNKFNSVQNARLRDKTVYFRANANEVWSAINAINRASVRVNARVHRANGGVVYGAGTGTSDSIPAMLSNGEYVMTAAAVQRIGVNMLDRLNYGHDIAGSERPAGNTSSDMLVTAVNGLRNDMRMLNDRLLASDCGSASNTAEAMRNVFNDGVKLKLDANGREVMAGMLATPISQELTRMMDLGR